MERLFGLMKFELDRKMKMTRIELDVDLEKFRYSLIGDGYLRDEVIGMSDEKLIAILKDRITNHIDAEYDKGERLGLYDNLRRMRRRFKR